MSTEYQLSYTASEIDKKLGMIDNMQPLFVYISDNQDGTWKTDKTSQEIYNAVQEGKTVVGLVHYGSNVYHYYSLQSSKEFEATFIYTTDDGYHHVYYIRDDGSVNRYEYQIHNSASIQDMIDESIANLPSTSGGSAAIIDVGELPKENINEQAFYRLWSGRMVLNGVTPNGFTCHCVNGLPETGEPATNANQTKNVVYYNRQNNEIYGYVDLVLSMGMNVPVGWYTASVLLGALGYEYKGVIYDISDDPNDGAFRFLLKSEFYFYQNGWIKPVFAFERLPKIDISWDGDMTDRLALDLTFFDMPGRYAVRVSNDAYPCNDLIGGYVYTNNGVEVPIASEGDARIESAPGIDLVITFEDPAAFIVYSASEACVAMGIPDGSITNGVYFVTMPSEGNYVSRLVSKSGVAKIGGEYLDVDVDVDLSSYATKEYVDSLISGAIGGSY